MSQYLSNLLFIPAITTSLLVGGLFSPTPARAEGPPVVAVFLMESHGSGLKADEVGSLTDYLATRLGEKGRLHIIPRDELRKRITAAKSESHKECFDSSCQIQLGRELAAKFSISSRIARVGNVCLLSASVWDLRKATQVEGVTERSECKPEFLIDAVDNIAAKLQVAMTGDASPRPAPVVQTRPAAINPKIKSAKSRRGKYLALAKNRYQPGETVEIDWFSSTGSRYDWLDVVPVGTKDDSAGDRLMYLGKKDGTFSVDNLKPGDYETRIYLDYNTKGYKVADRLAFQVVSPKPAGPTVRLAVTSKHLGVAKPIFGKGESIEVHYFGTTGSRYDWVAVVPKDTKDDNAGSRYDYLTGKEGVYTTKDMPPGKWEARIYLDYSKKGYKVADRISFTVR